MTLVTTIGGDPARIDIDTYPGEPVDFTVPVLDANGDPQDLSGWTFAAQVRASRDDPVLHTFTVAVDGDGVQVYASPTETAAWADWATSTARWDLWLTPPASPPYLFAAGWVRVETTVTH